MMGSFLYSSVVALQAAIELKSSASLVAGASGHLSGFSLLGDCVFDRHFSISLNGVTGLRAAHANSPRSRAAQATTGSERVRCQRNSFALVNLRALSNCRSVHVSGAKN